MSHHASLGLHMYLIRYLLFMLNLGYNVQVDFRLVKNTITLIVTFAHAWHVANNTNTQIMDI